MKGCRVGREACGPAVSLGLQDCSQDGGFKFGFCEFVREINL